MSQNRIVVCHAAADGKPCGRLTYARAVQLEAAGMGRLVRNRHGGVVRLMLTEAPMKGWYGGSRTTRRVPIRNHDGVAITAPIIEHKPLLRA